MNPYLTHYRCALCGRTYALDAVMYTCPHCGAVGTLDMCYDYAALRRAVAPDALEGFSLWRYAPLLPVSAPEHFPPLHVAGRP